MNITNTLKTMKRVAGNVRWSHKNGQYIAVFGGRGMATVIAPFWKKWQIEQKAREMEQELIAAKRGDLDAEAKKLWERKAGQRLVTRAPLPTVARPRK